MKRMRDQNLDESNRKQKTTKLNVLTLLLTSAGKQQ
jgi:hypothetical protein